MANKYFSKDATPSKQRGGDGGSMKAMGSQPESFSKQGTAAWPGVPGKTQGKSRAGGAPTTGKMGPFAVKKVGL